MSLVANLGAGLGEGLSRQDMPLTALRVGTGVRSGGLDEAHVALLMETDEWPPIVVWGDDWWVLDGAHRLEAARRLGRERVAAIRFSGTADEAFVESVRLNVGHGLPLSMRDRRKAALQVLARHGDWSDRRIASLCGLSARSIARLRGAESEERAQEDGVVVALQQRVGRDGKARPVQPGEVRNRIRRALEENPDGSLRAIAAIAGTSPETVRTVRAQLAGADSSGKRLGIAPRPRPEAKLEDIGPALRPDWVDGSRDPDAFPHRAHADEWNSHPAFLASADGVEFASWFRSNAVGEDWRRHVWAVPLGHVYEVVDEARRRAACWTSFASLLESRTR